MDREDMIAVSECVAAFKWRTDLMLLLGMLQEQHPLDEEVYHYLADVRDTIDPFESVRQLLASRASKEESEPEKQ